MSCFHTGYLPSTLTYKPLAIQPLHHHTAASILGLQGSLAQACIVVQEMQIRRKRLQWLRDAVVKEVVGPRQQDDANKCQDRELRVLTMDGFEKPMAEAPEEGEIADPEEGEIADPEELKMKDRMLKVGGIKLPGLSINRDIHN
jgi:hypothetical protein